MKEHMMGGIYIPRGNIIYAYKSLVETSERKDQLKTYV
jgi:hypothetical protein